VLSGVLVPTGGSISIDGSIGSLIDLSLGINPEASGRENIFLRGGLLGLSKSEVSEKFDEIVEFSGVEKFIDTPVKRYSSGMYVRLAFSVAANLQSEILIIDEVLAVGDAEFQKKCLGKMGEVAGQGRTVLFVSHNMAAVRALCNKGMFLKNGILQFDGGLSEAIREYTLNESSTSLYNHQGQNERLSIKRISLSDASGQLSSEYTVDDSIVIGFDFQISTKDEYNIFVIIKDQYGHPVFSAETLINKDEIQLEIHPRTLTRGDYHLHCFVHVPRVEQIDVALDVCHFSISDATSPLAIHGNYEYGNVFGNYNWKK
jgi:lipopolysaccharide transport system ATP-binding protein